MQESMPLVAIVDAYSSGHSLPQWFRAQGYDCIHVSSSPEVANRQRRSFRSQDFSVLIEHTGNIAATSAELRVLHPAAVLAGSESGVLLADELANALPGIPNNGLNLSEARRDKKKMNAALRAHGLDAVSEVSVRTAEEADRWTELTRKWPVVVKPCNSAGGDSVTVCGSAKELSYAVETLVGSRNKMGLVNESVLVQEYLDGEIFSVNTVSSEGRHFVTHIWQYRKRGILYDHEYLIPFEGELQAILSAYALRVLDALEISYGPAHIEIICRDNKPIVIDFGARLHGCDSPVITRECTGIGQDELTAAAYVNPAEFYSRTEKPYHVFKHLMTVDFISPVSGILASLRGFDKLRALESFHALKLDIEVGEDIFQTVDLYTSPGLVELVHRDFSQLERDREQIRVLEQSSLYDTEMP